MLDRDELADEDRVRAELVTMRAAANQARLRAGEHGHAVALFPFTDRETIGTAVHEMLGDVAVAEPEHVHAKDVGVAEGRMERRPPVDADQKRRRVEAERTDRGCENAVAVAV